MFSPSETGRFNANCELPAQCPRVGPVAAILEVCVTSPDSAKLVSPRSSTDEKVGGPVKNMGGPIKLLYITMFKIGKSCNKLIFGPVKQEKFSRCLSRTLKSTIVF